MSVGSYAHRCEFLVVGSGNQTLGLPENTGRKCKRGHRAPDPKSKCPLPALPQEEAQRGGGGGCPVGAALETPCRLVLAGRCWGREEVKVR